MGAWFVLVESNTTGSGRLFCRSARELGMRPVLLARDPGRYPYVAADEIDHRVVDTGSVSTVVDTCRGLGGAIAGVTSSSDYFVATAASVADALGLPHPDPDAIRGCRDKHEQRSRLRAGGVPTPLFALARSPGEAADAAARIGLPVVVKPVARSGSIATRLCTSLAEVPDAAAAALAADHAALVEEYLDGPEYSVETLDEQVIGVTRKHLGPAPYFLETGHDFPAPLEPSRSAALGEAAVEALRVLELGWGPAHVELRATPAGPRVIEVNPRLAGGMIPRLIEEAYGVDLIHHVVAHCAGLGSVPRPAYHRAAAIRFLVADRVGRFGSVHGVEDARAVPGVVEVGVTRTAGDRVQPGHSFEDRLAYVIAAARDGSVAASAADKGLLAVSASFLEAS